MKKETKQQFRQKARQRLVQNRYYLLSSISHILPIDKAQADIIKTQIMSSFWEGKFNIYTLTAEESKKVDSHINLQTRAVLLSLFFNEDQFHHRPKNRIIAVDEKMTKEEKKEIDHHNKILPQDKIKGYFYAPEDTEKTTPLKNELYLQDDPTGKDYESLISKEWSFYQSRLDHTQSLRENFLSAKKALENLQRHHESFNDKLQEYSKVQDIFFKETACMIMDIKDFVVHIDDLRSVLKKNAAFKNMATFLPAIKQATLERNDQIIKMYYEKKKEFPDKRDVFIFTQMSGKLGMQDTTISRIVSSFKKKSAS